MVCHLSYDPDGAPECPSDAPGAGLAEIDSGSFCPSALGVADVQFPAPPTAAWSTTYMSPGWANLAFRRDLTSEACWMLAWKAPPGAMGIMEPVNRTLMLMYEPADGAGRKVVPLDIQFIDDCAEAPSCTLESAP
jgi:rubredoxin